MKISELLDSIEKRDLVLPEFQREYVWSIEQSKELISSLIKDFPVGSLLFWKTDNPPELKNVDLLPEKLGTVKVILDGQQRLTTLFLLLRGKVPPYYRQEDITNDPRDLFFNLSTRELQYYQQLKMKDNPLWVKVTDVFGSSEINVFQIANRLNGGSDESFRLAEQFNTNLNSLRNVEKVDLPTQTVPPHATLEDAITIFDLVNSQGTKLTEAELALTHVTGKWSKARRDIKGKADELSKAHYYFDLTFMTRALTGVVCRRALYETIHHRGKDELQDGWSTLDSILDYLVSILPTYAFIHSTHDLSTTNALVPIIVYLSLNERKFPNNHELKQAIHWLYAAQIWARYTAQTDQRLEQDVSIVVREKSPWQMLCNQIIDQRGRLDVKAADLEGRGIQHPLYNMAFILAKAGEAVDWSNGSSLMVTPGKPYTLQNEYIFSRSLLYKNGYDSDNHMHRTMANEIANRVVLKSHHPYDDQWPQDYFPRIEEQYPGALSNQFIPMDKNLWQKEQYEDFLAARRELIALKVNEFMHALISEPIIVHKLSLRELIDLRESATLEFKSSLYWSVVENITTNYLHFESLKTIVAFLNSGGGTLLIGVEDNGSIFGLRKDLKSGKLKKPDLDGFQLLLSSLINEHVGAAFIPYIKIRFENLNGEDVCIVDVNRSSEPAYLRNAKGTDKVEFYVRFASTSKRLNTEETVSYIHSNW